VRVTVTTQAEAPPAEAPPAETSAPPPVQSGALSIAQARALQDESTAAMARGDWSNALALAQRALERLSGTGDTYEAYANYNVGRSLIELGNCGQGLPYIDRSEQLQGTRSEFADARAACA
jgi:ATP/maltotriose-dependent transcriptional regulator MalT